MLDFQSMWAERERPSYRSTLSSIYGIQRSVPAPKTLHSAHAPPTCSFLTTAPLCSSWFSARSAHMLWWRLCLFSCFLRCVCHNPSTTPTDRHRESNVVQFSLQMWHLVATILMIFLIINCPNCVYSLVDPDFSPSPSNFYEASPPRPPQPYFSHNSDTQT